MAYLLNLVYLLALLLAAPWLVWQSIGTGNIAKVSARSFWAESRVAYRDRPCVWFHAVSVGEVNLLATLLAKIAAERPDCECVVSTTTMTGYALARRSIPGLRCSTARWISVGRCGGRCANSARRAGAGGAGVVAEPDSLVAGGGRESGDRQWPAERAQLSRLSANSLADPSALARIDLIAAQNDEYAERFMALGARPQSVHVTGSIKFDRAETDRRNPPTQRLQRWPALRRTTLCFSPAARRSRKNRSRSTRFARCARRIRGCGWCSCRDIPSVRRVAALLDASGVAWQRRSDSGDRSQWDGLPRPSAVHRRTIGRLGKAVLPMLARVCWSMPSENSAVGGDGRHRLRRRQPVLAAGKT